MGCPLEFVISQGACVVKCPTMYTLQVVEGVPSCVAKDSNGATITSFGLTSVAPMTDNSLSGTSYINWGPNFVDAYDTFTQDLAVANSMCGPLQVWRWGCSDLHSDKRNDGLVEASGCNRRKMAMQQSTRRIE